MSALLSRALRGITRTVTDNGTTTQNSYSNDNQRPTSQGSYNNGYRGRYQGGRGGRRGRGQTRQGFRGSRGSYNPRSRFEDADNDEDVAMDGDGDYQRKRYRPYGSGHDRRSGYSRNQRWNNDGGNENRSSTQTWSKISIPHGAKHEKNWLMNRLQKYIGMVFQPVSFHVKGDMIMFFIEDVKVADALRKANNAISVKDGSKISISVKPCPPPREAESNQVRGGAGPAPFDEQTQQIFKESLSQRYEISTNTMNLNNLFRDEVLNKNNIKGILSKHWIMETVRKVIQENCPEVRILDLSDNRISHLDGLKEIATIAPHITELKLGNNMVRSVSELEKLKSMKNLVSLDLNGNPLCDNYQDQDSSVYISAVRNFLPRIQVLDGQQLPPTIAFDLPSNFSLPTPQGSYLGRQPQIKELILKFLQQYYMVYDSDDRQKLLEAYHDHAIFSLSTNNDSVFKETVTQKSPPLGDYLIHSRNLKKITDFGSRFSLLKHSRLSVVAFLNELPSTKHDLDKFIVDVSLELPTCVSFSVSGLFTEGDKKILRGFTRVFAVIPSNGGQSLMIVNDQLHIRNPTQAQYKAFSATPSLSSSSSSSQLVADNTQVSPLLQGNKETLVLPQSSPASSGIVSSQPIQTGSAQQQELVQKFSQQSGMNIEFSMKCLIENEWNYDKAAQVFVALQSKGSIPPEAFKK